VSLPTPPRPPSTPGPPTRKQQRRQELIDTKLLRTLRPTSPGGAAVVMALALAVLWALLGLDAAFGHPLLEWGIKPRQADGLVGIVLAPFLHAGPAQLVSLSVPFAVLGWLMLTSGLRYLAVVTITAALVSGLVGWLAGPSDQVLVGVSGVVLGWLGYLLARALFGRRVLWIAVAVAVTVVFSGLFNGLLPRVHHHEFWGSQLAAFVVGAALGAALHRRRPRGTARPSR
jgi:membrane associated rhomboid family serine protease